MSAFVPRSEFEAHQNQMSDSFRRIERQQDEGFRDLKHEIREQNNKIERGIDWKVVWSAVGVGVTVLLFIISSVGALIVSGMKERDNNILGQIDLLRSYDVKSDMQLEARSEWMGSVEARSQANLTELRNRRENLELIPRLDERVNSLRDEFNSLRSKLQSVEGSRWSREDQQEFMRKIYDPRMKDLDDKILELYRLIERAGHGS